MRFRPALLLLTALTLAPGVATARPDPHHRDPLASWSRHARGVLSASMQMWMSGPRGDNECGTLTDDAAQIYVSVRKPSKADLAVLRATLPDLQPQDLLPSLGDRILLHATVKRTDIARIASLRSVEKIDDAKCSHLLSTDHAGSAR